MSLEAAETIRESLSSGLAIPYLGPGVLALAGESCPLPASPEVLVDRLTAKASVPHKIRKQLTAAAQFIENFKHRKTVATAMTEAFRAEVQPTPLHRYLAAIPALRLIVHAWYDDLPQRALAGRKGWGLVQGVSQAEHFGQWVHYFDGETLSRVEAANAEAWMPLLYQPLGSVSPAANFLVSDSDFVEVLTEIDIQTPIPEAVQNIRKGRHFLFLGCRFSTQLERIFAFQIIKRSSDRHWAILPETPTRNEARFLAQYNIERIAMPLPEFATLLTGTDMTAHSMAPAMAAV
ncbi:MAG: SIR2 family protein [Rhodomicrobium sp.]|nr:SIR2 family protein [Rhodomicrobium sp.]